MACPKSKLELNARAVCLAAGLALGCTPTQSDDSAGVQAEGACDEPEKTQVAIITEMRFARVDDNGQSWGANLDESTLGCGVDDFTDPEGATGVDNSFGTMIPILELTEGAAIEVYIQDLINRGEVLIMLEMEDLDDAQDDGCVDVNLLRGLGDPTVGTDRIIEAGQTFDRNLDLPQSRTESQQLDNGTLIASPLQVELPFNIFDIALDFTLHSSTLRFNQGVDGHHSGYIAGGLYINEIIDFVSGRQDIDIGDLVIDLVENRADLWPDNTGQCQGISVVFEFEAKPAFFYAEPE